jgi:hypothetical protein
VYDGPGSLNGGDTGESTPATVTGLLVHAQLFPFGGEIPSLRGRVGAGTQQVVRLVVAMGTLLGPEETNTHVVWCAPLFGVGPPAAVVGCSSGSSMMAFQARPGSQTAPVWGVCGLVVVGWSLVENCTVDASIFVVKLSRANGGCLGTRSR